MVVAAWLASMPVAAFSLVACTTRLYQAKSHEADASRSVWVEWAFSGKPIGSLRVCPGRAGTADQILDFLVAHNDALIDPLLFNDHNGDQLVLDDQMCGLVDKLVATSGKLGEEVMRVDCATNQLLWVRTCYRVKHVAKRRWTNRVGMWADQLVKSLLEGFQRVVGY